jgi:hypothetical protein
MVKKETTKSTNMKNIYSCLFFLFLAVVLALPTEKVTAGNKDRSGEAGASELLINPWAKGSSWGSVGTANCIGTEAFFENIAGLAHTPGTEILLTYVDWLKGSGVNIYTLGFSQKLGKNKGVLGVSIMSMNFGDITITTTDNPDATPGVFKPSYLNINLAYAKAFSNSIYGGINVKLISESIDNASATGLAIDAGIQYITGAKDQIKFGVALKNVGTTMKFSGDGLSFRGVIPGHGNDNDLFTVEQRSAGFQLPATLRIGASYDFLISELHRITLAGNFQSNSFTKDQFTLGLEYALKYYFSLRTGYTYQNGMFSGSVNETGDVSSGLSAGFSVFVPINKEAQRGIGIDYSYRSTSIYSGTHTVGIKLTF